MTVKILANKKNMRRGMRMRRWRSRRRRRRRSSNQMKIYGFRLCIPIILHIFSSLGFKIFVPKKE